MDEKLLIIKYHDLIGYVYASLYTRTKMGLVLVSDNLYINKSQWEDFKKEINAEYIDLDKEEHVQYNTSNEGDEK